MPKQHRHIIPRDVLKAVFAERRRAALHLPAGIKKDGVLAALETVARYNEYSFFDKCIRDWKRPVDGMDEKIIAMRRAGAREIIVLVRLVREKEAARAALPSLQRPWRQGTQRHTVHAGQSPNPT